MKNYQKFLYVMIVMAFTQVTWGVKIAQPQENEVIKNDELLIFIYPTPLDIEENRYVAIEVFDRKTGEKVSEEQITPSQNYQTKLNIKSWQNGRYLMRVMYTDSDGYQLEPASWRNFMVKH